MATLMLRVQTVVLLIASGHIGLTFLLLWQTYFYLISPRHQCIAAVGMIELIEFKFYAFEQRNH